MNNNFGSIFSLIILFFLSLIYLPFPGLESSARGSFEFDVDETPQLGLFSKVQISRNLNRPFPEISIREDNPHSEMKVELGRLLYFDPILSSDNDISCAHCHHPDLGFSDNRGLSMGKGGKGLGPARTGGAVLRRGSPTIWNAAFNLSLIHI